MLMLEDDQGEPWTTTISLTTRHSRQLQRADLFSQHETEELFRSSCSANSVSGRQPGRQGPPRRMLIAKTANELVFGPLPAAMDEEDAAKALSATQEQLTLIHAMIQAPSPSHLLWSCVASAIEAP